MLFLDVEFSHMETHKFSQPKKGLLRKLCDRTGICWWPYCSAAAFPTLNGQLGPLGQWSFYCMVEMGVVLVGSVFQSSSVSNSSRRSLRKQQHRKSKMTDPDIQLLDIKLHHPRLLPPCWPSL